MVEQIYFKGDEEANAHLGGAKYAKYNKRNNNSENFRGRQDCC